MVSLEAILNRMQTEFTDLRSRSSSMIDDGRFIYIAASSIRSSGWLRAKGRGVDAARRRRRIEER